MPGSILVIDDVVTNRILMKVRLAESYYRVLQAETGQQALEMAMREAPDLIVLSLGLKGCDALALCAEFRQNALTSEIPVLALVPDGAALAPIEALRAGAEAVLTRPLDEALLQAHVRHLIRAHQALRDLAAREATQRALALEEHAAPFQGSARIALMARRRETAIAWKAGLARETGDQLEVVSRTEALAMPPGAGAPDLFVLELDIASPGAALRGLTELRALPATRHAAIICVVSSSAPEAAAMALDLGASDVVIAPCAPAELALRIRTQLARKRQADRLRSSLEDGLRLALTDALTGLANRRHALPNLARLTANACASGRRIAALLLDLDRFKQINDAFGHAAGDVVLAEIGERLRRGLRPHDLAARIGGEEFLIVLPDLGEAEAMVAAEQMRRAIEASPIALPGPTGQALTVTTSIGVAIGGSDVALTISSDEAEMLSRELLDRADRALYGAKARGRNRVWLGLEAA